MQVSFQKEVFLDKENIVSYKYQKDDIYIYINLGIYTKKFKEYQKNLFNELYTSIIDIADKSEIFLDFKKSLEKKIKQFNTQLKIFQEKTNLEEKIEIKGNIQVVWKNNFISSLIGESSIIIYRDNKLEVVVPNEVEESDKIDIFSEIIEGELENGDKILTVACNIYDYLSDSEIKDLVNTDDIVDSLKNILSMRIEEKEIGFITYTMIEIEKIITQEKKEIAVNLEKYKDKIKKNKYVIGIVIGLGIVFFVIISIFSYIGKNQNEAVVEVDGKKQSLNLTELKRKIDAFTKLENTNTQVKQQQYNEIMQELDIYEKAGIQKLEIKELRKKMEQNYYKGFNINIVSENDGILNKIYTLKDKEKASLEKLKGIIKNKGTINVYGSKGALLSIVNEKTKPIIEKISIPTSIKTCINNLRGNGLYCVLDNNDIYNFSKYGIKTMKNSNGYWSKNIVGLGTFGRSNFYTLSLDENENKKGLYIKRYMTYQGKFGKAIPYPFAKNADKNIISSIYTGSNMVVDGSFLIWTKNGLAQAYKEIPTVNKLKIRIIKGYEQGIIDKNTDLKGEVKIIAFPDNSNYIYLYDKNTKSLIVYYSKYKNSQASKFTYQLTYLFKVKFDLNNENVIDITVDNKGRKANAYILTDKNIYQLNLSQFRE